MKQQNTFWRTNEISLVHAIDGEAGDFYKHFGFEECPLDGLHLVLLMKDLRDSLHAC